MPCLLRWLSQNEISRFYGGNGAAEVASIKKHVQKGDVCSCLILEEERPVGYLQFYEIRIPKKSRSCFSPLSPGVWHRFYFWESLGTSARESAPSACIWSATISFPKNMPMPCA